MALSEFDIIARYFNQAGLAAPGGDDDGIQLGIGDDCALLSVPEGCVLAMGLDVLVADVHFPADGPPGWIAAKALAVNLSDLAAMGAAPVGFTMGITLPSADGEWLAAFSEGLRQSAQRYGCFLMGGDVTRGPLTVAIQAHGYVEAGRALLRGGASPGDRVWVTGALGAAGLAVELVTGQWQGPDLSIEQRSRLEQAYYRPVPRLSTGRSLVGLASAAIDISDGLIADLGHIAEASGAGIKLNVEAVPVDRTVVELAGEKRALELALGAGDDYELAFTIPATGRRSLERFLAESDVPCREVGEVTGGSGVTCVDEKEREVASGRAGYTHF